MKTQIRTANINDLTSILKLNKYLFEFEKRFSETYNQDWTYSTKGQDYFKKRISENNILVYEIDEQVIGYISGNSDTYSFRNINPIFEIENMCIKREHQRQNIGSQLIEELEKILKIKKIKLIKVGTLFQNDKAIHFYQKNKFYPHELFLEKEI